MSILLAAASLLARIMHAPPSRDRGDGRATGQPQGLGPEAYFSQYAARSESRGRPASGCAKRGGAGGRVICETKRIRSHYLLLDVRQASRTLDATPLQGRASPYTINDAITPRRDVFVEQITLPRAIRSRLEAAPTAFLPTEPKARRDGRPHQRSQQVIRA